jgi:glucuronate isomerase
MRGRPGDADPSGRVTEPQHGNREFLRAGQGLRHSHSDRVHPGPASDAGPFRDRSAVSRHLFTVDETVYSRELAPIAGTYPSVRLGAPWWFLDSPEGIRRFRESATETAGFYNTSGFVDDTRAYASIPARHDLFRRVDAGYLARLVLEHRLSLDEAVETAIDLAYRLPKESYQRP